MSRKRDHEHREPRHDRTPHSPHPSELETHHTAISTPLKPLTPAQDRHLKALKSQTCVFSTGPAGTGKTFLMAAYAAQQLRDHAVEQVVVTRPTVEAGSRGLGFLKGTLQEKFEPWLWSFLRGFHSQLGKSYYEYLLKSERIMACPLQYTQGLSFSKCLILADEFENATLPELKMLLTRVGDGTRIFLAGDTQQTMVQNSGFSEAIHLLKGVPGVQHIEYGLDDIVRSDFCRRVLEAFDRVNYREPVNHGVFAP